MQTLRAADITSYAFLTDHHLLLSVVDRPGHFFDSSVPPPTLAVVDFLKAPSHQTTLNDLNSSCIFAYPDIDEDATPIHVMVRSDPAPSWRSSSDLKAPFCTLQEDRLFVITLWVADTANILRQVVFFVPSSTFISHLNALAPGETQKEVKWEEWGPKGSRVIDDATGHSTVWVCYVFGMRYIAPSRTGDRWGFRIYSFNQLDIRRRLAAGDYTDDEELELFTAETMVRNNRIFKNTVVTSLPYRVREMMLPFEEGERMTYDGMMLSEDSVVAVSSVSCGFMQDRWWCCYRNVD